MSQNSSENILQLFLYFCPFSATTIFLPRMNLSYIYIRISSMYTLMSETSAFLTLLLVAISISRCSATPPIENGEVLTTSPLPLSLDPQFPQFFLASLDAIPPADTKTNKDVLSDLKKPLRDIIPSVYLPTAFAASRLLSINLGNMEKMVQIKVSVWIGHVEYMYSSPKFKQ